MVLSTDTSFWVALFTFLTACVGCARWLIHVYWSQAREIQQLKNSQAKQFAMSVDTALTAHRAKLDAHSKELVEVSGKLLHVQAMVTKTAQENQANTKLLADYIETTAARFKKLESEYIQLKDGLMMIKGRSNGPKN